MTNDFMHVHVQVGREGTVLLDARRDFRSRSKLFGRRTAGLHIIVGRHDIASHDGFGPVLLPDPIRIREIDSNWCHRR